MASERDINESISAWAEDDDPDLGAIITSLEGIAREAIRERDHARKMAMRAASERDEARDRLADLETDRLAAFRGEYRANLAEETAAAERERSRRLVAALLEAFPADDEDWAGSTLRRVLAEHGEPRPVRGEP